MFSSFSLTWERYLIMFLFFGIHILNKNYESAVHIQSQRPYSSSNMQVNRYSCLTPLFCSTNFVVYLTFQTDPAVQSSKQTCNETTSWSGTDPWKWPAIKTCKSKVRIVHLGTIYVARDHWGPSSPYPTQSRPVTLKLEPKSLFTRNSTGSCNTETEIEMYHCCWMQKEVKLQWIAEKGKSKSQKDADIAAHLFSCKPDICPLQSQKWSFLNTLLLLTLL